MAASSEIEPGILFFCGALCNFCTWKAFTSADMAPMPGIKMPKGSVFCLNLYSLASMMARYLHCLHGALILIGNTLVHAGNRLSSAATPKHRNLLLKKLSILSNSMSFTPPVNEDFVPLSLEAFTA